MKQGNNKLFKSYLEFVRHFKDKYILVQPSSSKVMLNVFRTVPVCKEDGTPRLNELGDPMVKMFYKLSFQWMRKHFDNKLGSYIWRKGSSASRTKRVSLSLLPSWPGSLVSSEWAREASF